MFITWIDYVVHLKISSDERGLGENTLQILFPPAVTRGPSASPEQLRVWPCRPLGSLRRGAGEGGRHRGHRVTEHTSAAGSRALLSHKTQETWRWAITGPGSRNRRQPQADVSGCFLTTNGCCKSSRHIHDEVSKGKDHFCTVWLF